MSNGYKLLNWQNDGEPALNAENLNALTDCVATAFIEKTATSEQIKNAIQAVHNAGGGSVVFPAGTWELDSTINLDNIQNVVIKGQGKYVTFIDGTLSLDENCTKVEIKGVTFEGSYGIDNDGKDITIENCILSGVGYESSGINNKGNNVSIENCICEGDSDSGIFNSGENMKIINNTCSGYIYGIWDSSDPVDENRNYYSGNEITGDINVTNVKWGDNFHREGTGSPNHYWEE